MRRAGWCLLAVALLPAMAGAVRLRHQFKLGSELRYKESFTATGGLTLKSALGDQTIPVSVQAEEQRSMKVTETADNGQFWLESRSLSGKATVTVQGEAQQENPQGSNFQMRVDPLGNLLEIKQLATTVRDDTWLDMRLDSVLSSSRLAGFPPDDVEVGGTWDKEVPVRAQDGKTYRAQVSNRLLRLRDGGATAEIESRYEVPIPPSDGKLQMMGMEIPVRISGLSTGTVTTTWDVAHGRSLGSKGKGDVQVELTLVGLTTDPAIGKFAVDMTTVLSAE